MWPRLFAFAACCGVLSARGCHRIVRPKLWAEDGGVFLARAYESGWQTLFEPYAGYLHALPRLLAIAATWLPVQAAPALFTVASGLLAAWCLSEPASARFAALRGGPVVRTAVCAALCLSPGLSEVFGNVANLYSVLALWLLLLGARQIGTALSWPERILLPLAAFTAGGAAVLFPLFAWRAFRRHADDVLAAATIGAAALVNLASHQSLPAAGVTSLAERLQSALHALAYGLVTAPLAGTIGAPRLWSWSPAFYVSLCVLLLVSLLVSALRDRTRETLPLAIGIGCIALLPFLMTVVRSSAVYVLAGGPTEGFAWFRHSFLVAPAGLLAWTVLLSRWPARFAPRPALALATLAFVMGTERWGLDEYYGPRWPAALETARAAQCQSHSLTINVPISPPGWVARIPRRLICNPP